MFNRIYIEIGNICNLACSFCPPVKREKRRMSEMEFAEVCRKIKGHTEYIYLHVMGEPLLHPDLARFLEIAAEHGFKVCITTNGTLLSQKEQMLLSHADKIHRVSISLHCIEGNGKENAMQNYLENAVNFAKNAAEHGIYTVFRLWNLDSEEKNGENGQNSVIEDFLRESFRGEWQKRWSGFRLAKFIFLEYAGIFTWPTQSDADGIDEGTCHGMIDQLAILADGTAVPCCLDSQGQIPLGNIFKQSFEDIISSPRAQRMCEGFKKGEMREELCRRCTYARRFGK